MWRWTFTAYTASIPNWNLKTRKSTLVKVQWCSYDQKYTVTYTLTHYTAHTVIDWSFEESWWCIGRYAKCCIIKLLWQLDVQGEWHRSIRTSTASIISTSTANDLVRNIPKAESSSSAALLHTATYVMLLLYICTSNGHYESTVLTPYSVLLLYVQLPQIHQCGFVYSVLQISWLRFHPQ